MLLSLTIRDMVLVERLTLEPGPGLTVLTGETGAGKSILLDALGFVLGWSGRAGLVRAGAATGDVEAVFTLAADHPARAVLAEAGLEVGDELILRRVARAEGPSSAFVNDRRAGAETLRALADCLVEIHGQHDDRGLLDARGHRTLLDAFARASPLLATVRAAWAARRTAAAALEEAEARLARARAEEDFLRHAVAELDRLAPESGEEAALDVARRRMQAAARIREDVARALTALGDEGAGGRAGDALRWLEG
ncbi:MAG: DNA repair protein RecN, partial [Alphaproteobacteria bacterium HGW-Alphaproteobacteria-2]